MKTKLFTKLFALIAAGALNNNCLLAQTYGRGALTNDGSCTATGTGGGCSNTFIGSSAAGANNNTGTYNTFIGSSSGNGNTSGASNSALGGQTLQSNTTGSNNNAFGYTALFTNTGSDNSAFGHTTLYFNSSGTKNLGLGNSCLYSNSTGSENTVGGYKAGYFTATGVNNTIFGTQAGYGVTGNSFSYNCMFGYQTGYSNTTGGSLAFFGYKAGYTNTASYNSAFGAFAGYNNTTGIWNSFLGYGSGYNNTTGDSNIIVGHNAMYYNQTGGQNTVVGIEAGLGAVNQSANRNSFFGWHAGITNQTGSSNTCIGYGANVSATNSFNRGAFGFNAVNNQGNNTIYLGDANHAGTFSVGGQYTQSDGRYKNNVIENVKGLEFIMKLRPITYNIDTRMLTEFKVKNMNDSIRNSYVNGVDFSESANRIRSGFIAQEVEQAGFESGFTSSIVYKPTDDNQNYAINYAEIVVPLVKAVQEQQKMIDSLVKLVGLNNSGQLQNDEGNKNSDQEMIENKILNKEEKGKQDLKLFLPDKATIGDAQPNPSNGKTQISYYLPKNVNNAKIIFTDMLGKIINEIHLETGYGTLNVDTQDLPLGIYSYSLIVNGIMMENKKIICNK